MCRKTTKKPQIYRVSSGYCVKRIESRHFLFSSYIHTHTHTKHGKIGGSYFQRTDRFTDAIENGFESVAKSARDRLSHIFNFFPRKSLKINRTNLKKKKKSAHNKLVKVSRQKKKK